MTQPATQKRSFTIGHTPSELITELCKEQCPNGYPMTLKSKSEWLVLATAWNQGIDSHLEAMTERSSADHRTGKVLVHPEELHVLLRRLYEGDGLSKNALEAAWMLRKDILQTLGIEEI